MLNILKIFTKKRTPIIPIHSSSEFSRTDKFVGMTYKVNNTNGRILRKGDKVIVHPTTDSEAREPFEAEIIFEFVNWTHRPSIEVCTNVPGKHSAVMNDYLFNRLEPISK